MQTYNAPVAIREIVDYFTIDHGLGVAPTLGATIVLDNGDVIDADTGQITVADTTPGRHALSDGKHGTARTVLGIARRLSVEHPHRDLEALRAQLIVARADAGHDVAFDRLSELALRDGIAALVGIDAVVA